MTGTNQDTTALCPTISSRYVGGGGAVPWSRRHQTRGLVVPFFCPGWPLPRPSLRQISERIFEVTTSRAGTILLLGNQQRKLVSGYHWLWSFGQAEKVRLFGTGTVARESAVAVFRPNFQKEKSGRSVANIRFYWSIEDDRQGFGFWRLESQRNKSCF
jgi:hypothetical protein